MVAVCCRLIDDGSRHLNFGCLSATSPFIPQYQTLDGAGRTAASGQSETYPFWPGCTYLGAENWLSQNKE
jgi:hypothetical protein